MLWKRLLKTKLKLLIPNPNQEKEERTYEEFEKDCIEYLKRRKSKPTYTVNKDAVEDYIKNKSKTQITKHKLNEKERGNNRQAFEKECIDFDDLNFVGS